MARDFKPALHHRDSPSMGLAHLSCYPNPRPGAGSARSTRRRIEDAVVRMIEVLDTIEAPSEDLGDDGTAEEDGRRWYGKNRASAQDCPRAVSGVPALGAASLSFRQRILTYPKSARWSN